LGKFSKEGVLLLLLALSFFVGGLIIQELFCGYDFLQNYFCMINWALFFASVSGSGIQLLLAGSRGGVREFWNWVFCSGIIFVPTDSG
jgi:hypothetical protein